jgi:hypothetical protein
MLRAFTVWRGGFVAILQCDYIFASFPEMPMNGPQWPSRFKHVSNIAWDGKYLTFRCSQNLSTIFKQKLNESRVILRVDGTAS